MRGGDVLRLSLSLASGEELRVQRVAICEGVSSLFAVEVEAVSPELCVDFDAIAGRKAALRIEAGEGNGLHGERVWSGVCSLVRQVRALELRGGEAGVSTYALTIVPALWRMALRTDHRIYQHLSAPEIGSALLEAWGLDATWRIDEKEHPRLAYKVQYGETDLDFFQRLLEEAGIAYALLDDGERSRLVLADALRQSAPRRDAPLPYVDQPLDVRTHAWVTRVAVERHARAGAIALRDNDFMRPAWALFGQARSADWTGARTERYRYQPGASAVERDGAAWHDDRYAARLAARALEAEHTGACAISFQTNALDLRPGTIVVLEGHPRPELDPRAGLLVTSLSIEGSLRGGWSVHGTAVPASEPYRPARRTPKPVVHGMQSGVVVGPAGEEIHTDVHGRVRVQFPWDRLGAHDEHSSCWLRVCQGWAGAGYGLFALPRVGQEVLVAFLEGDPDQPVVVGRLSNALNPVPLKLPEERTQSLWRSASSPGGEGFNELRFEDRKGAELVSLRAERQLRTEVGRDEALVIRGSRAKCVGGDESARTEGRALGYVGKDAHITVDGELRERVGGTRSLTVDGDRHERIGGVVALEAGGAIHLKAGGAIVIEAGDVTLRGPGGFVRIDASGVSIDGGAVRIQQGGAPGGAPAARPALPLVPSGAPVRADPVRLPLLGFAGGLPPMQAGGLGGGGGPLTPEEGAVCGFICRCKEERLPQQCVTRHIRALEDASAQTSPLKAEVPYDMSKRPPEPIMSKNDPRRATRSSPKGSRIPDVVVVKDGTKPPTRDNIKEVIEIKFPPDELEDDQRKAYTAIAGKATFKELGPNQCGCPRQKKKPESRDITAGDVAEVAALTMLVVALVLDDAVPGGQADDVAIPPAVTRILGKLAPLLRGAVVVP
ncbi:type VI secretion system tip protein TssI/VgrG [Sorangium sp. So ce1389]|uniref:type VI secretion system tip protein TssI/VgrG n=1 Tax=Sorangium sp. So ce1389 TaxID=3133336 RepID=UPI003F5EC0E0